MAPRQSVEDLLLRFAAALLEVGHTEEEVRAGFRALVPTGPTEAQLQRVDAVLMAFTGATLSRDDVWRLKHRVRKALEGEG